MYALRIDSDATVTDIHLPATGAHIATQHVGSDAVDQGVYHGGPFCTFTATS